MDPVNLWWALVFIAWGIIMIGSYSKIIGKLNTIETRTAKIYNRSASKLYDRPALVTGPPYPHESPYYRDQVRQIAKAQEVNAKAHTKYLEEQALEATVKRICDDYTADLSAIHKEEEKLRDEQVAGMQALLARQYNHYPPCCPHK